LKIYCALQQPDNADFKEAGERAKDVMRRFVLSQPSPTLYSLLELERLGIHA
jgi:hypothetical protein